jgi:hypothetical protein
MYYELLAKHTPVKLPMVLEATNHNEMSKPKSQLKMFLALGTYLVHTAC